MSWQLTTQKAKNTALSNLYELVRLYLEAGEFEEVLLFRHLQKVVLDVGVHLGQNSGISHRAGKVTEGDGVLGVHLSEQVVTANLRRELDILKLIKT